MFFGRHFTTLPLCVATLTLGTAVLDNTWPKVLRESKVFRCSDQHDLLQSSLCIRLVYLHF